MKPTDINELRERAQKILEQRPSDELVPILNDFERLVEEHNIQKIELELQQDQLITTNQKLELQNKRLDDLFENAPIAYFILDESGRILQVNRNGFMLLGKDRIEILKKPFTDFISPQSQDDFYFHQLQIVENKKAAHVEVQIAKESETDCYCLLSSLPYLDSSENKWFYRVSATDISHSRQINQLLKKSKESAEEANMAKSRFLANISHEIRTPLNAIMGFAEILKNYSVKDDNYFFYLNGIEKSSKALFDLISDILDLSRSDAGKLPLKFEEVNIEELLGDVKQIFMLKTKAKGLDIVLDVDASVPKALMIDRVRLQQILFNLVGNAVKFTNEGYVKIHLRAQVATSIGSDVWVNMFLSVEDTGIGISDTDLPHIFEPFFQKAGTDQEGTGLGLPIAKRFVEAMNGSIKVKSFPDKGTSFFIEIPGVFAPYYDQQTEIKENDDKKGEIKLSPNATNKNLYEQIAQELQDSLNLKKTSKEQLQTEIWSPCASICDIIGFEEILDFSNILFTFATRNDLQALKMFADALKRDANKFKVSEINEMLANFYKIRLLLNF